MDQIGFIVVCLVCLALARETVYAVERRKAGDCVRDQE